MGELASAAAAVVEDHLRQIQGIFKPDVRLTIVARTPNEPDADFVITGDEITSVIAALHRTRSRESAQQETG